MVGERKAARRREDPLAGMTGVDPRAFEVALAKIQDGSVFERFAHDFLARVLGYGFVPVGGLRDRGIDGLEHTFASPRFERRIYQASIEKDARGKVHGTLAKLHENKVQYNQLFYITNIRVPEKDRLIDDMFEEYRVPVSIFDVDWFKGHVNDSQETVRVYLTFVDSYLHEFNQPGKAYEVADLEGDPRLFVFLRQQWEEHRRDLQLDEVLADTLILYALQGTDPEKGILRSREEILAEVRRQVKFDPALLQGVIERRLGVLSKKPRRIKHHRKEDAYCLPYETRVEIQNRNFVDVALYEGFRSTTRDRVASYFQDQAMAPEDALALVEKLLNRLFHQQGLEFASFVLRGENPDAFEKSLPDLTSQVVDSNPIPAKNRADVKNALLMAIRDLVYNGTVVQKQFLQRLSRTYMMLFLLQCDPKLATYFGSMASNLRVYVDTSILVPAMSEYYLEPADRRYWNLLKGARAAGVRLLVNETIIGELASHFRLIGTTFWADYDGREIIYADEPQVLYVPQIMIRAYFYAKMRGNVSDWVNFVDTFVSPRMDNLEDDLIQWLRTQFGIEYAGNKSMGIHIERDEEDRLYEELRKRKTDDKKARSDAKMILAIYSLREQDNESGATGIFGYRTWWLSTDIVTHRAVTAVFADKYKTSCYLRPDFLYNYVCLAPSRPEVDEAYSALFPTLVGVKVSFDLPHDVIDLVQRFIKEHAARNPARLRATLRDLAQRLHTDAAYRTREKVRLFLDERRAYIEGRV